MCRLILPQVNNLNWCCATKLSDYPAAYHLGHMCLRLLTAGLKQLKAHIRILWRLSSGLELRLTHPFPPIFLTKGNCLREDGRTGGNEENQQGGVLGTGQGGRGAKGSFPFTNWMFWRRLLEYRLNMEHIKRLFCSEGGGDEEGGGEEEGSWGAPALWGGANGAGEDRAGEPRKEISREGAADRGTQVRSIMSKIKIMWLVSHPVGSMSRKLDSFDSRKKCCQAGKGSPFPKNMV